MRPSSITDGITRPPRTLPRRRCGTGFNEAVEYYRRNHDVRAVGRVDPWRASMRPSSITDGIFVITAVETYGTPKTGFNEAVEYYRRNLVSSYSTSDENGVASMRPSSITDGIRRPPDHLGRLKGLASMRPSSITDGISRAPVTAPHPFQASMRPSSITDGIRSDSQGQQSAYPYASMRPSSITDGIAQSAIAHAEAVVAASMRPSSITDGIAGCLLDKLPPLCAASMRPSSITDGIPGTTPAARMGARFNEAVEYYRRNPGYHSGGSNGSPLQ